MGSQHADLGPRPEARLSRFWAVLILLLILYIIPLIAIAIDEIVLRTFWIARQFPPGARSVFFDVYPFLRFLK